MIASIIIPTYNNASLLEKTLNSILNQSVKLKEIEVIICDDGSSDNTRETCDRFRSLLNIQYLFQEDKGFRAGAARNMGIRNANSEICIFVDTGILLSSNNIKNHIEEHLNSTVNKAVVGYVYGFDNYSKFDEFISEFIDLNDIDGSIYKLQQEGIIDMREVLYKDLGDDLTKWPAPWLVCWTSNLSAKKSVLTDVGGFDEWYNTWGCEDTDLALAMHTHGVRIELCRKSSCIEYPTNKHNVFQADPELANREFERKRNYINKKYNLTSIKIWYDFFFEGLNEEIIRRKKNAISIVWQLTRQCPWNCNTYCTTSIHNPSIDKVNKNCDPVFSFNNELNLLDKMKIIDSLTPGEYIINFIGGEIFIDTANTLLIQYAADRLGKDSINIRTSGAFVTNADLKILSKSVKYVEFSLDYIPLVSYKLRPKGYNEYVLYSIKRFQEFGIPVGIQTTLTTYNKDKHDLERLLEIVLDNKVKTWSLQYYSDLGDSDKLSINEFEELENYTNSISKQYSELNIKIHYFSSSLDKQSSDFKQHSIRILPDGTVTSIDKYTRFSKNNCILGRIPAQTLRDIIRITV